MEDFPELILSEIFQYFNFDELLWIILVSKKFNYHATIAIIPLARRKLNSRFEIDVLKFKPLNLTEREWYKKLAFFRKDIIELDLAAWKGDLNFLKFATSLSNPIYPSSIGANWAIQKDRLNILQFLAQLNNPVYPNVEGANEAVFKNSFEILEFLTQLPTPIYPDYHGANWACNNGNLNILKFLINLPNPVYPSSTGIKWAKENGHLHILEFLKPFYPISINL